MLNDEVEADCLSTASVLVLANTVVIIYPVVLSVENSVCEVGSFRTSFRFDTEVKSSGNRFDKMSTISQPPVQVSPFIRGCRWIAFTSGIAYGVFNFNRLSKKEARFREIERQKEEALKPKRLAAKKQEEKETYVMLNREVGIEIPAQFK